MWAGSAKGVGTSDTGEREMKKAPGSNKEAGCHAQLSGSAISVHGALVPQSAASGVHSRSSPLFSSSESL